tara:strand:- start:378 stop:824 length:447 start_codon:yes stop_codon:yes gene_type:complete
MILLHGLLDYSLARNFPNNIYLFTGNSYIKRDGKLVMGRGAARQVRDMYPAMDADLGCQMTHLGFYGLLMSRVVQPNVGVFQVKWNYSDKASLDLIAESSRFLLRFAVENPGKMIHMNYPGIGNGGLNPEWVHQWIRDLPDNVHIYRT